MATIRINTRFFPLAFFLFFFPARARIDGGQQQKLGWFKTSDISVSAGTHRVLVDHGYLIPSWNHKAEMEVTVQEGQTIALNYRAPVLAFLPGKMQVVQA